MICFFDIETKNNTNIIVDLAAIDEQQSYIHENNIKKFRKFLNKNDFFVGHNILKHDIPILIKNLKGFKFNSYNVIDTLLLSLLVEPEKPYHHLIKEDKLDPVDSNNPLNDSKNSKTLFFSECDKFNELSDELKSIYYTLLKNIPGFSGFFSYINFKKESKNVSELIKSTFFDKLCESANVNQFIKNNPVELAYALALITTQKLESNFPSWIIMNYPFVEEIIKTLRSTPCEENCSYCSKALNPKLSLNNYFEHKEFKKYEDEPLQEQAINLALRNKSMIVVFPTGGGKSVTYQLPALMIGQNSRSLTVVISPLQSLMKDQVDGLEKKGINRSATINGLLDPVERGKTIERVRNGEISLLYLAPESLRSRGIEKLLLERDISRFVIDEAHCFSTWGHDFRVDYLYIGKFIKLLQDKKGNHKRIPVSCFTATAKQDVIKDIEIYFKETLDLNMEKVITRSSRKNLRYKVIGVNDELVKYREMRSLINQNSCPTIIYASRTKTVDDLYDKLYRDGHSVSKFHGQMEKEEKVIEQNKFMMGETNIMIATSAFGMGVDKSDVKMVIHYEISNSIENYIQEAGRAGRDENIEADCYILYNEEDLDKHFRLLSQTKLNQKEIQQVWTGIKNITKTRKLVTKSALEIARSAGWDDEVNGIQTRITTAIATLEDTGYLIRKQNAPRVFADSILVETQIDAVNLINKSTLIIGDDKEIAKRITKSLISSKYTKRGFNDEAETRVDYLADILALDIKEVMRILRLLREEHILADVKDLRCSIKKELKINSSKIKLDQMNKLLRFIIECFSENKESYNIKEINENAQEVGIKCNIQMIKQIINYLDISHYISITRRNKSNLAVLIENNIETIVEKTNRIYLVSSMIVDYLFDKSTQKSEDIKQYESENLISFSIEELKKYCNKHIGMIDQSVHSSEIEDALYYLKKIESLNIEGGFLVIYNPMTIERIEDTSKRYLKADFQKLDDFYQNKTQQIHIVGEYAKRMMENYNNALNFVNDYFVLDYDIFLQKHFNRRKTEISRNMSVSKFKEIYANLSTEQYGIIDDKENNLIVVAAGPGSGKTRLLVHKLASIFYTEDIRHEQLLMLTFSRSAVDEFKERIVKLIGSQAFYFEIKTFHSFCFDLLGRMGDIEKSESIIKEAVELIKNNEVEQSRITKMIIVIDEAQDMRKEEYELIELLVEKNENVQLIAVGDDDQNIYEFRGSSNQYLKDLSEKSKIYELSKNYRSKKNIVAFANLFLKNISNRLKSMPIESYTDENGKISIIKYDSEQMLKPLVNLVINLKLSGKSCILTKTNLEANYISGMLNKLGYPAQLIQDNSKLKLYSFQEIRDVFSILERDQVQLTFISENKWVNMMSEFTHKYKNSIDFPIFYNALKSFDKSSGKFKFVSDLQEFMKTAYYDDFIEQKHIVVSTLHKAKGREFDNVFIVYDKPDLSSDEEKRLLYVGITRAISNLYILYRGEYFKFDNIDNYSYNVDGNIYDEPEYLEFTLTHKELNLGYFEFTQKTVEKLEINEFLSQEDQNKFSFQGRKVLQFSKSYIDKHLDLLSRGYELTEVKTRHKLYWFNPQSEIEYLIILPILKYNKNTNHYEQNAIQLDLEEHITNNGLINRKETHDYIKNNLADKVYVNIENHKSLLNGDYLVTSVTDFFGGIHEGEYYYSVYVMDKDKKINVGCKSIKSAFIKSI